MRDKYVKKTLTDMMLEALAGAKEAGLIVLEKTPAVIVESPREEGHGDFASTVALGMAKTEGKPPRKIAEIIRDSIKDAEGIIDRVEIAGPGFMNFFLKADAWLGVLRDIERQGGSFGHSHVGNGK